MIKFIRNSLKAIRNFFPWYIRLYKGRAWYTKTLLVIVSAFLSIFIYFGMVDINFLWLFGSSPGFKEITEPPTFSASEIYSADSVVIGKFFKENRTPIRYEEVNPKFWDALISTEDERFYSHIGIDPEGLAGAAKDALTQRGARGASTITQQLAKNMFQVRNSSAGLLGYVPGLRMLIMKTKEWIISLKIEKIYTKKEILTMYANTVDFGNNAYGIKTAARTYFNTTPAKLTTDQIATLVGMLKATTYYNPILNPKNSIGRRNTVLYNMLTHNKLSQSEYDKLSVLPLNLDVHMEENYDGKALYFRQYIAEYLKDWAKENGYDLYSSGLRIYTTIDTRMQKYAEEAAKKQMRRIQKEFDNHWRGRDPWRDEKGNLVPGFIEGIAQRQPFYRKLVEKYPNQPDSVLYYLNKPHTVKLFDYDKGFIEKEMSSLDSIRYMVKFMHCSMVAMEPETGAVRAWVGDIDFKTWKYDKVTAERQPGSTFKLFVYTEAMNQGLTPCDKRRDEYFSMDVYDKKTGETRTWTPRNANGRYSGDSLLLKTAFARSVNTVAVRLGQEMGIKNIIRTAQDMGIKSPLVNEPSLALGSSDVNLLELANAYCTIANDGEHREPIVVTKILDQKGNEVYVAPNESKEVIPYKSAFYMQQLLKAGKNEAYGTSLALSQYTDDSTTDWGGKTGTTNNHSDAWFMAVSPKLVVGAWVGGEYRSIHFRTGALGQGSKTALPICGSFIQAVMNDRAFAKYKAKWVKNPNYDIPAETYMCDQYYTPQHNVADSIEVFNGEEGINDPENGELPIENGENPPHEEMPIPPPTDHENNRMPSPQRIEEN